MVINVVDNGATLYCTVSYYFEFTIYLLEHVLPNTFDLQLSKDMAEKNQTGISQKIKILCDK